MHAQHEPRERATQYAHPRKGPHLYTQLCPGMPSDPGAWSCPASPAWLSGTRLFCIARSTCLMLCRDVVHHKEMSRAPRASSSACMTIRDKTLLHSSQHVPYVMQGCGAPQRNEPCTPCFIICLQVRGVALNSGSSYVLGVYNSDFERWGGAGCKVHAGCPPRCCLLHEREGERGKVCTLHALFQLLHAAWEGQKTGAVEQPSGNVVDWGAGGAQGKCLLCAYLYMVIAI